MLFLVWQLADPGGFLQRLYSMFPGGWPGSGLLLLRGAVGITLIIQGSAYAPELQIGKVTSWGACLLALAIGGGLLVGLLTRLAGVLAVLWSLGFTFRWLPAPSYNLFLGNPFSFDLIIVATACTLLGPGAFSLDRHLFGRRKIMIPHASHASNS